VNDPDPSESAEPNHAVARAAKSDARRGDPPAADEVALLIARIADGDRSALREIHAQASPLLFGILRRYLPHGTEAEDALHDVLIKIWRIAPRFDPSRKGMPWLVTVARNHAVDVIRARRERPVDQGQMDALGALADPRAGGAEMRMALGQCLARLDPKHARLVLEVYVLGYTYEEAAERFDVPIGTVRTWLRRSVLALRACLEGRDG
jgi:RNA polymerase sigma-70 factor (ECF subfamily)